MLVRRLKALLVAVLSLVMVNSSNVLFAQENVENHVQQPVQQHEPAVEAHEKKGFDANEVIIGHVRDAHEWHLFTLGDFHATLPLPVILFSEAEGLKFFMSSKLNHGHDAYQGYRMLEEHYIAEHHLDTKENQLGNIIKVNDDGTPNLAYKFYNISITKNIFQLLFASVLLLVLMIGVAGKYKKNPNKAPSGFQNAVEPFIVFVRDDIAKPMLAHKHERYMPLLLTMFFFIWINNLMGLLPGAANVTGNISVTIVLAVITFIVTLFSSNKHYWAHIFNPPVPMGMKPILIPVEVLGMFTKPFALMVRLFANMVAGHLIILSIVSLIFIFGNKSAGLGIGTSVISVPFSIFMYFLELLVAFIQAFIFTNLTALFIGQAFESEMHGGKH